MKILAIDLSALFRQKYEAEAGKEVSAAYRRTLETVARIREGYDRVAVCCDADAEIEELPACPSFRVVIEPAYKTSRERPPPQFYAQQRRAVQRLEADGYSVFYPPQINCSQIGGPAEGFYAEGDDVIGSLAFWCAANGHRLDIYGDDKDFLQLVDDAAGIFVVHRDGKRLGVNEVREKMGVDPYLIPALLAMGGDDSDGYKCFPGWEDIDPKKGKVKRPGIAEKGAAELIRDFGLPTEEDDGRTPFHVVSRIFAALDRAVDGKQLIDGHRAVVLRRHKLIAAVRGCDLATLRTDLPLDFAVLEAEPVKKEIADAEAPFDAEQAPTPPIEQSSAPLPTRQVIEEPARPLVKSARDERFELSPCGLEPMSGRDAWVLAGHVFNSRMFPKFESKEAIFTVILMGRERGVMAITSLENAFTVHNQVGWKAAFIGGLVMRSGLADYLEVDEFNDTKAIAITRRRGRPERRIEFNIEHARKLGYLAKKEGRGPSQWETQPANMLRWRALTMCARTWYYDVVAGMYLPSELRSDGRAEDTEMD